MPIASESTPAIVPVPLVEPPIVTLLFEVAENFNWPLESKLAVTLRLAVLLTAFSKVWIVSPLAAV